MLNGNYNLINERQRIIKQSRLILIWIFRLVLIIGLSYVILGPLIGIIASSFFSDTDQYSPMTYLIPQEPTLEKYEIAIEYMSYFSVIGRNLLYVASLTVIQLLVCSMVGYGFARHDFPGKKILFACVIIMIVIPSHTIMLPLYTTFQNFNPFWLVGLLGANTNVLQTVIPMYVMSFLGTGLRAGLYIYIFNQFFRGLPKEIEEAASIDGAGAVFTYFRIMLPNAMPSVITVTIFSIVWQYNDTFFANLFLISSDTVISKQLASLGANIGNSLRILDPNIVALYTYAGVVMVIIPVVALYVLLQKQFIEGVERSGIVG